jgi:hypothetical protein
LDVALCVLPFCLLLQLQLGTRWRRRDFARLSEIRHEAPEALACHAGSMSRITARLPRTPTQWMWAARTVFQLRAREESRGEFDGAGHDGSASVVCSNSILARVAGVNIPQ